jgi:hypothetical protein
MQRVRHRDRSPHVTAQHYLARVFERAVERREDLPALVFVAAPPRLLAAAAARLRVVAARLRVPRVVFLLPELVFFVVLDLLLPAPLVAMRSAARSVEEAARRVPAATDRPIDTVFPTALSAVRLAVVGELRPVISTARSVSAAAPSMPAATPRPTSFAPVSIMLLTALAVCRIAESLV